MATNVPVTLWQPSNGNGEYSVSGVYNIVDTIADYLVDPLGDFIVDTGLLFNRMPTTVWSEDDGQ